MTTPKSNHTRTLCLLWPPSSCDCSLLYSIHDHVSADLDGGPPDGLHGQGDEAGDGVRDGEVVHQVVHVSPHSEKKLIYKMIE